MTKSARSNRPCAVWKPRRLRLVDEIIVVDDGSRDGSQVVLERLAREIDKLKIIETPGLGRPAARNRALGEARASSSPSWTETTSGRPRSSSTSSPLSNASGNIGLVYGDFVDFSRDDATDGRVITVRRFNPESAHHLRDYFVHDGPIMLSTVVVRRSVFDDVGLFDESFLIGQDTEFCLRVATSWRFCHVPGAFTFKRRHPGQITARLDAVLPNAARVTQQFASRHPELRPLAGRRMASGPRKGQRRLCDEGRMAQCPASPPPRDPPRPALLACLGQRRPPTRASLCRTALLRGDQETLARPPAVVAFCTTILVRQAVCEFSTC